MNLYDTNQIRSILPRKIFLTTSNGNWELKLSDVIVAPPQISIIYHHNTTKESDDVLSDGEPDYLGFDLQLIDNKRKLICDITYGDAMMFSFEINQSGKVYVGHYNGYGSKFDPDYEFYFQEQSIDSLMGFFEKITSNKLKREEFNFLDGDKHSFKIEKIGHNRILNFDAYTKKNPSVFV